jgi:glycosyltransferase involved in cell wall biosynthesis
MDTTTMIPPTSPSANDDAPPDVEVVLPAYNEMRQLAASVRTLRSFLDESFPYRARIVIVDNASTDRTWAVARHLADTVAGVDAVHLDRKGRGRALRAAWTRSTAAVVAYMDVDLATDLRAFLPLVAPLVAGHSDIAIGTRLAPGAHVIRGARRELLSRSYNLLVRTALNSSCSDAQCGFKAMRREAATELLPLVEDNEWFFDTELLIVAERIGLRIHELPVDWVDDLDSRVDILQTAWKDLRGVIRLARSRARRRYAVRPTRPPDNGCPTGAVDRSAVPVKPPGSNPSITTPLTSEAGNQAFDYDGGFSLLGSARAWIPHRQLFKQNGGQPRLELRQKERRRANTRRGSRQ